MATTEKEKRIKEIIGSLKPNAYMDNRPEWDIVKKGLLRMSAKEISAFWVLIIGKREM